MNIEQTVYGEVPATPVTAQQTYMGCCDKGSPFLL